MSNTKTPSKDKRLAFRLSKDEAEQFRKATRAAGGASAVLRALVLNYLRRSGRVA